MQSFKTNSTILNVTRYLTGNQCSLINVYVGEMWPNLGRKHQDMQHEQQRLTLSAVDLIHILDSGIPYSK